MQSKYCIGRLEEEINALFGRGAPVCGYDLPGVDTPFVRCFQRVNYEKALAQLVVSVR